MNKQEKSCNKLVPQHSELMVVVINVCGLDDTNVIII